MHKVDVNFVANTLVENVRGSEGMGPAGHHGQGVLRLLDCDSRTLNASARRG